MAVLVILFAVIAASLAWGLAAGGGTAAGNHLPWLRADTVGIIRIEGPIAAGPSGDDLLGAFTGSDDVLEDIREAMDDPAVKAVVLRINSPGGSAAASQEIGREVQRLREAGKVVVVSMGDVAASGGYWIAAGADKIVASPATITGSIGVIMEFSKLEELYRKLGVEVEVIKSGPHKDIGSPSRGLTETERDILQGMVNDIFDQFVQVVAEGRNLPREEVEKLADGRIFTGRQARDLGLVDELGNFTEAVDLAAGMAGIAENFRTREIGAKSPLEKLLGRLQGRAPILPGGDLREVGGWFLLYRYLLHRPLP